MRKIILILIILILLIGCVKAPTIAELSSENTTILTPTTIFSSTSELMHTTKVTPILTTLPPQTTIKIPPTQEPPSIINTTTTQEIPTTTNTTTSTTLKTQTTLPVTLTTTPTTITTAMPVATSGYISEEFVTLYKYNWHTTFTSCVVLNNGNIIAIGDVSQYEKVVSQEYEHITYGLAVLFNQKGEIIKEHIYEEHITFEKIFINQVGDTIIIGKAQGVFQNVFFSKISDDLIIYDINYLQDTKEFIPNDIIETAEGDYIITLSEKFVFELIFYSRTRIVELFSFSPYHFNSLSVDQYHGYNYREMSIIKVDKNNQKMWELNQIVNPTHNYFTGEIIPLEKKGEYAIFSSPLQPHHLLNDYGNGATFYKYSEYAEEVWSKRPLKFEAYYYSKNFRDIPITITYNGIVASLEVHISKTTQSCEYVMSNDGLTYYIVGKNLSINQDNLLMSDAFICKVKLNLQ